MHIDVKQTRASEEMVHRLGGDASLAQKLVDIKLANDREELRKAQDFQESVVAKQNERGFTGADVIGQCIGRIDAELFCRIVDKHGIEIAADPKKFWLVTAPKLYPELGTKPTYVKRSGVFSPGKLRRAS